ncbi:hypothetical protein [Microbacterium sp.]|uniref:hypothetical protein n=1 Tax=Microbacterium sp. TaxID=51671 RepID=UPI003F95779F
MKLSTIAQSLADEIKAQDWSDAHTRADGARHDRQIDHTQSEQLSDAETDTVQVNVVWVVGQALRTHDPNFDIHVFAEAAGVSPAYRLRNDGSPSGAMDAGIRPVDGDEYTPRQLARLLGYRDESRPGKVVRDYLRSKYPNRRKHSRWKLTEHEAADVLANVPPKR